MERVLFTEVSAISNQRNMEGHGIIIGQKLEYGLQYLKFLFIL